MNRFCHVFFTAFIILLVSLFAHAFAQSPVAAPASPIADSPVHLSEAETCLWSHTLTSQPQDFSFQQHHANHPTAGVFTTNGLAFIDEGLRKRADSSNLSFPAEVAETFHEGEVVMSVDIKVEGVEGDAVFGWILQGKTFTQWTGNIKVPQGTEGWHTYTFCPWERAWPDLERFIFSVPIPQKGSLYLRNFVVKRKFEDLNVAAHYNTGYEVGRTAESQTNCFGMAGQDLRNFSCLPWTLFAGVPLKPVSHQRNQLIANEMVRFSTQERFPGVQSIVLPVSTDNFSAQKLYLLHTLYQGSTNYQGKITFKGQNNSASQPLVFGRDIKNIDDAENKPNAFKGLAIPTNWGQSVFTISVSQFEIPSSVGPLESIIIEAHPQEGLYCLLAAHLSNFAYTIDERPLDVIKESAEWRPFPFPKKSGVIPGSVLDTGARKPTQAGQYGRLISGPKGELVAEKNLKQPLRMRMNGTGAAEYYAEYIEKHAEANRKEGEKYLTEFTFAPYSEDIKVCMENAARMLAMQNVTMFRVIGFNHFTAELGVHFTAKEMDNFFYWIKCLKENGIYVHLDIGHPFVKGRAWTNDNAEERHLARVGINFSTKWRNLLLEGMTKLMTTVNPYTGLALKDDPIVVFVNGWNESAIGYERYDEPEAVERFSKFLSKRYASIDDLKVAWSNEADTAWSSFTEVPVDFSWCRSRTPSVRRIDIWDFYTECQIERLNWFKTSLRKMGYQGMVSDYNFAQALEGMRSRMYGDYVVMNRYHEHPLGEWIQNKSPIETKNDLMRALASIQFHDRPYVITESGVCFWNDYRYEQAFVLDAYAALNGIDVLCNFAGILPNRGGTFQRKQTPLIRTFFGSYDPIMFATEFLGAHFFNLGKVKTADSTVCVSLDREEITNAQDYDYGLGNDQTILALVCKFGVEWQDDKRGTREKELTIPRVTRTGIVREEKFAYMVDDRSKKFDADRCIAEMKEKGILPAENRTSVKDGIFESVTGELYLDSTKKFGSVNTPKAQVLFAQAGTTHALPQFEVKEMSANGALGIVSSDDASLDKSKRMTVVYATNALNEGLTFRDNDHRIRIINGKGPVLYQTGRFTITLKNRYAKKLKAYVIRLDGSRDGELPVSVQGDTLTLSVNTAEIPGGPAVFFELVAE